jgi:IS5 family transposase
VLTNARRKASKTNGRGRAAVRHLAQEVERVERVVMQTTRRLAGETVIAYRVVSLCDFDARPIRRGKPQKPNEFGYKVAVGDTPEGFVVAHQVHLGNPFDTETLRPILKGAKAIGMRVRTVFADRGFGNEAADAAIAAEGIPDQVIPRVGKAAPVEATRSWRRRYRWRAGAEGRISHLKRRFRVNRTRLKGHTGAQIWMGYGVLASNLSRMAALADR